MKKLFYIPMVVFLGLGLFLVEAEAARFGGGKNVGRQSPPTYSRQTTPPATPAPSQNPSQAGNARSTPQPVAPTGGGSRWLGILGGVAAGGLLASLFLGHGFAGLQIVDILVLAGLGVGVFFLVRFFRKNASSQTEDPRFATVGAVNADRFQSPEANRALTSRGAPQGRPLDAAHLTWFNEESFMRNARTYFLRLQEAWDAGQMEDIEEYVTPELYQELIRQRAELGPNYTEVVNLNVDFLGLSSEGDIVLAGVRYSGLIRENQGESAHPFSETWHVQRSLREPNANWYVAGIQQG
ncbi:Tim44 domain-containing protein [Gammaproteobacteria bacterium]